MMICGRVVILFAFIGLSWSAPAPNHVPNHPIEGIQKPIVPTSVLSLPELLKKAPSADNILSPVEALNFYPYWNHPWILSQVQGEMLKNLKDQANVLPIAAEPIPPPKGVIQNGLNMMAEYLQSMVNRQQQFIDMLTCRNCHGGQSPWMNFLNAMSNVPALGWIMRPSDSNGKPLGTFIAATNQNGIVSGVGGSIINNEPIVEYTFTNNHIVPVQSTRLDINKVITSPNILENIQVHTAKPEQN